MLTIDRGEFWARTDQYGNRLAIDPQSYQDAPQSIDFNVVISAPHLHAHVLVSSIIIINKNILTNL